MASMTTTAAIADAGISRGEDGRPDYGTRLRRARLGLLVALTPVLMLFVSFTSAYVVRQGLPTLDPRTNNLIRDWIPVALPRLLLLNTFVLLVSSVSMELARRQIKARAVMETASTATGPSIGGQIRKPWLAMTFFLGLAVLFWQWAAWEQFAGDGVYVFTTPSRSFLFFLARAAAAPLLGGGV